ncbi:cytochrome P450 [Streptomyces sp. UNOC14_S4]|uniref:cytochrome P450 n=1 Tax=Streptomyces sp. UNOC14_S4 TaxID=2872340 RepID=UPI001E61072E|nr:cytochrome P450 [Streptomyces sp. UNOC14_S4]MCC3771405.1 cytochrome P450 [Streptomyces sp. UNOC14_S4]
MTDSEIGPEPVRSCPFRHDKALEPDPFMSRMLQEAPVTRVQMPYGEGTCWLVTRYDYVATVTSDKRFSRAALIGMDFPRITPAPIVQSEAINVMDPPDLNRVRKIIVKAFTTKQVEEQRPLTQATVNELLDGMEEHGAPADIADHLAGRLPLRAICDMLQIPEEDRRQIRQWAMAMMSMSLTEKTSAAEAKAGLRAYFSELSAERRANPGSDLISSLAQARVGEEMLDSEELAVLAMLLVVTGHDTTTYDICNVIYTLLTHPDHLADLRSRPEILPQALEELLRYIPFRQGVGIPRVALEDVEFDGVTVKKGDVVHVSYLTANRDGRIFPDPDVLDFDRKDPAVHMAFGYGSHHCLGSHMARMVLQVTLATLLERFPKLRLAVPAEEVKWNTTSIWRYPLTLPVAW